MGTYKSEVIVNTSLFHGMFSELLRNNCPKLTTPANLLSNEERKLWDESEVIQNQNTELVQAILARYGFTEVKFFA